MSHRHISHWRPRKFADFVGEQNRNRLKWTQQQLLTGRLSVPLLIVAIYGYAKTSLARLILLSLNCSERDPVTADPCGNCVNCKCFGTYYWGHGAPYRRYEYDCTILGRAGILQLISDHCFETDEVIFLDELHHLHERLSQEPLLKFVEDYGGLVIAAVMEDRLNEVIPPLQERFHILRLVPPTEDELVDFFCSKTVEWKISAPAEAIRYLVVCSAFSFRICLRVLAACAEREGATLTTQLVDELLNCEMQVTNPDDGQGHAA